MIKGGGEFKVRSVQRPHFKGVALIFRFDHLAKGLGMQPFTV